MVKQSGRERQIAGIFITKSDPSYDLFMEFATLMCHSFLCVMCLNAFEMTGSISIQSLDKVKKATALSFIRQIILLIPISLIFSLALDKGIYGLCYAGYTADAICFIVAILIIGSEYKKLKDYENDDIDNEIIESNNSYKGKHIVIAISREYASGGRYVGRLIADSLGIKFYDKELISLTAKESGLSKKYINDVDEAKRTTENDDRIFIAETKVIKKLAKEESCVIVGRCSNYILKDNKDTIKVFLYSDMDSKIKRAVKYYDIPNNKASKIITKVNKERRKHYKYYTNEDLMDINNYDLFINVDTLGVEKTSDYIIDYINKKNN